MDGFPTYFNYGEIVHCKNEKDLQVQFDRITMGFSGIPSASVQFNHALNQKEALDWLITTATLLNSEEILDKATDYRKQVVETMRVLLI